MIELKISSKVYNGPCLKQRPVFPWRLLLVAFPRFIEKGRWLKFKWLSYPCGDRVSTPSAYWGNFNKGLLGVETGLREPLRIWAPRDRGSEKKEDSSIPDLQGPGLGGPEGIYKSSNTTDLHSLPRKTLAQLKLWLQKNPLAAKVACKEGDRRQWVRALVSCPGVPNSIPHWLKLRVGWLRGGAQKIVGHTSPGEMSERTECHMCSYINRLMPLKCFPLSQQNCSIYREGKHLATLMGNTFCSTKLGQFSSIYNAFLCLEYYQTQIMAESKRWPKTASHHR